MDSKLMGFRRQVEQMMEKLPSESSLRTRCERYLESYQDSADYLAEKQHSLAFIGKVGAGKTTAICHLFGLLGEDGKELLSIGSGRTTLCEVEIRHGDSWLIEVEPHSREEVEAYIRDFSQYLYPESTERVTAGAEDAGMKLSAEIDRALRNLLDLKKTRESRDDGKRVEIDPADGLAKQCNSVEELFDALVSRFDFKSRVTTRFEFSEGDSPREWLRSTFKAINHGTDPSVGLAKRIVVTCPLVPEIATDFTIRVIDTKGVDQTVDRADLDRCLDDHRGVSVLCSGFPDAPDKVCEGLLRNAKAAGLDERIQREMILLILDRDGEAEDVIDIDEPAGDSDIGRQIKQSQIEEAISRSIVTPSPEILFFNSRQDDPSALTEALSGAIRKLRQRHLDSLAEIEAAVAAIAQDIASQTAQQAKQRVRETLEPWLKDAKALRLTISEVFNPLVSRIAGTSTYAASVRASVNRRGSWTNLDYYRDLGVAARNQVVGSIGPARDNLYALIDNMLEQASLQPAYSLLKQVREIAQKRTEHIQEEALQLGRVVYESDLRSDGGLWQRLMAEWGQGSGYKIRVARGSAQWFELHDYPSYEERITENLVEKWEMLVDEIECLLGD